MAFCVAYGRGWRIRPRVLSLLVALGLFGALFLVPFVKYPANPPAIGNGDTIGPRAMLYGTMVLLTVLVGLAAIGLGTRLAGRFGAWTASWLAVAAFVVVIGVVMALLPPLGALSANAGTAGALLTETPQPLTDAAGRLVYPGFDADLLYWFRLYSVGAQVLLWTVLGGLFGPLAERVLDRATDRSPVSAG